MLFEEYFKNFLDHMIIFKNILMENHFESFSEDKLIYLQSCMKDFLYVLNRYLKRSRNETVQKEF